MRFILEAVPRESGCMSFTPDVAGSIRCKCGHTLYDHYMCGSPEESRCRVCRTPINDDKEPKV